MIIIDGFEIDVAMSVTITRDSVITSHPVEIGSDKSDHIRNNPATITLECLVSDTPLVEFANRRGGVPSEDARAKLLEIRDFRQPVSVEIDSEIFDSMGLESFVEQQDAETGGCLSFRVTFKRIEEVTNERRTVPVAVPRAAKKTNLGQKPSKEVTQEANATEKVPEKTKRDASALNAIYNGERPTSLFGFSL